MTRFTTLTFYLNLSNGFICSGSGLSYKDKHSGTWYKLPSLNCNQNRYFARVDNDKINVYRNLYHKDVLIYTFDKLQNDRGY